MNNEQVPLAPVQVGKAEIHLLGTAHVSRASALEVEQRLTTEDFDAVAIEICPSRHRAIVNPDALEKMDLGQILREGKVAMIAATLALGAFQNRIAERFDIEAGAEMRTALAIARERHLEVVLIDRELGTTLKRIYHNVPWWKRMYLIAGLVASVLSSEEVSEDEIERLKEGDMLESVFAQFAEDAKELYVPLISERDLYMAAQLSQAAGEHQRILAVVGAGHLKGIGEYLREGIDDPQAEIKRLDHLPKPSRWPKLIPWAIVALILAGFAVGFGRSSELGIRMVSDWFIINGGLAALGTIIAGGHYLSIATAFFAAPLTSLNPTIGAGMVTGAVEIAVRKPTVGDFSSLRQATSTFKGWRENRVARTLLVFLFSTLGSAAGTYLAGFLIFYRVKAGA